METIDIPQVYLPKQFTPTVTFKDGTKLNAKAGFNITANELWVWPSDPMDFAEASALFTDVSKTDSIRIDHSAIEYEIHEHYTHLKTIQETTPGMLSIRLTR